MTNEELQELLLQEQEKNKELSAKFEKATTDIEKLMADNKKLTEYNNKLFCRLETPIEETTNVEKTADEIEADEIEAIKKLMKERRL